jgi:formiminotetrahydrofolate cyclodeaminase
MTGDGAISLASLSIGTMFDQASSTAPVPGGGCISAVCGYLAVAILLKSIRISTHTHPEDQSLLGADRQLMALADKLLVLAQVDSDSFSDYMRALKLPKTTQDEVALRQRAIHAAAVGATVSALNILDVGNQILDIAHNVQGRVSASILADEKSAVELTSAMNSTAEWNAAANLGSLSDGASLSKRLEEARAKHAALLAACHAA